MNQTPSNTVRAGSNSRKLMLLAALFFLLALPALAQNTKGDQPSRPLPKLVQKAKPGKRDRAKTKDISGRRLRTRNKSTAAQPIIKAQSPYRGRKKSRGDRPAKPIRPVYARKPSKSDKQRVWKNYSGNNKRVKSKTAEMARENVYPQFGDFQDNPSKKPRSSEKASPSEGGILSISGNGIPGKKRRVSPRSGSRSFVLRGRKNVYWGKFSKGERPFTRDITGRRLRVKNFHTPALGFIKAPNTYRGKGKPRDRAYKGSFRSGFTSASGGGRAWRGDVSGHAIRSRPPQSTQNAGRAFFPRKLSISARKERAGRPLRGSGSRSISARRNITKNALPPRAGGIGASGLQRFLNKFTGKRTIKGGGSVSNRPRNNRDQPIPPREPGNGSLRAGVFSGNLKSQGPLKGGGSVSGRPRNNRGQPIPIREPGRGTLRAGAFSGNLKSQGPLKGGGSISGRSRNNHGQPIPIREPGRGTLRAGAFSGNLKSKGPLKGGGSISGRSRNNHGQPIPIREPGRGTLRAGAFSGNLKSQGPLKGGGSISGRPRNNHGQPIPIHEPGRGTLRAGVFSGNIKSSGPLKGGGSISGRPRNNRGQPIPIREPGRGTLRAGVFSGNIKSSGPLKGGGSISGRPRNNGGKPIPPREPGSGTLRGGVFTGNIPLESVHNHVDQGEEFTGFLKASRPLKGGGSISGRPRNNGGKPIPIREPGKGTLRAGVFSGNIKTNGPLKGGGSISGKLWNNDEKPIQTKSPAFGSGNIIFAGKVKKSPFKRWYVKNPNSAEDALKIKKPNETTYAVDGLQIKVRQGKYEDRPKAKEGSMKGIGPNKATVRASEYLGRIKVYWSYQHNPSSAELALKTTKPLKSSFSNATSFTGRTRLTRNFRHNPNSAEAALKVLAPGKVTARIGDYQGNLKMHKYHGKWALHPDAQFAGTHINNVKEERTILINFKLFWSKLFRKNSLQPSAVKDKVRRPRYDKKERELWKDLYDDNDK